MNSRCGHPNSRGRGSDSSRRMPWCVWCPWPSAGRSRLHLSLGGTQPGPQPGQGAATLLAESGVEPQLDDLLVTSPMNAIEDTRLRRLANLTMRQGEVLRLRVRDLHGNVAFSDDGSGFRWTG